MNDNDNDNERLLCDQKPVKASLIYRTELKLTGCAQKCLEVTAQIGRL